MQELILILLALAGWFFSIALLRKNRALARERNYLRVRAEVSASEFKSAHTRLSVALESSSAGVWEIFREGDVYRMHYDENFAKLFRIEHTRPFTTTEWADYLVPITDHEINRDFLDFLRNFSFGPELATSARLDFPDGTVTYIKNSARLSYNEDGSPRSMVGMCIDISERVHALDNSRRIAETILNSMDAHIYVSDIETDDLLFVNIPMLKAFNISSDYSGRKCWDLFMSYEKRCEFCPKHQLDKEPEKTLVWENVQPLLDQHSRHIDKYINWLDGEKVLFHTMLDISDIRRAEKEMVEAKNAAEQANMAKSRFLSSMSHEIRTPMNAIVGMTSLALKEEISSSTRRYLEKISSASDVLLGLINNILDMSKIDAGKLELSEQIFRLSDILAGIRSIIQVQAGEKQQKLTISVDSDVPAYCCGDPLRLTQIITNVLSNAVKFSGKRTEIFLRVALVSLKEQNLTLLFEIEDQGIGISEEHIKRLFSPFEQGDNQISLKYGGTGLGLALSKRIVEKMAGHFSVSSEPGKGSTFAFTARLKAVPEPEARAVDSAMANLPSTEGALEGKTIMVVDDVDINREIVMALLEPTGARLVEAEDGLEAVRMFSASPASYDLILMDVQMPVMGGYQATGEIRAISRDVPVIAMTANAFKDDVDQSLKAGMNDHVSKPVDEKELMEKVVRYIMR